jgi:ATP-dependent Clp protease ATP-binding subunit ClpC
VADTDYTKSLEEETRDLVQASREGLLPAVHFRDTLAEEVLEHLDNNRSVLLIGDSGVGKTAVIHAVARKMARRKTGGLAELSTAMMMSGTRYLGEWQSKATAIAKAATAEGTVLFFTDAWNLPKTGRTAQNDNNLLDALRPHLTSQKITLLAEASPDMVRLMERQKGFVALFHKITVPPLDPKQVDGCLDRAARGLDESLDESPREALVKLTTRFLPSRPQPGPALRLLEQVHDYRMEKEGVGEPVVLDSALVERVFSVYSGLPLFVVSRHVTRPASEIRAWFEERIVGQREAIEAVVETIALFKAGLHDPGKPLGTFLFVGPTGVGKTELARALASFLFGSAHRLLRFDLSEFKDYHSYETLIGNAKSPERPATLVDPVRAQPFQVVLFDELEKAHSNVWDLLLGLLDEGRLTPPDGTTVDFRNCIVICTSNVGALDSGKHVGFGSGPDDSGRRRAVLRALEGHFRPEFLNRFQHVTVFHQLSAKQVKLVARHEIRRILARDGIAGRNLVVEVDDAALDLVIERGYDVRYGARALKREIQRQLVLPLAMTLMERSVEPGAILHLRAKDGHIRVRVVETERSRETRREKQPVVVGGEKLTKKAVIERTNAVQKRIEGLADRVDENRLVVDRTRLGEARTTPDFWNKPEQAAIVLRDLDRCRHVLDRLERLRGSAEAVIEALQGTTPRAVVEAAGRDLKRIEARVDRAWRELVVLGLEGYWDALIEVAPVGPNGHVARDLLVKTYQDWCGTHRTVQWLRRPLRKDEPAMMAIKGTYAAGLLDRESGLHRIRDGQDRSVARVRVAPWTDAHDPVDFAGHKALKGRADVYGARVRSRLETRGGLVLQNELNLSENRELAREVDPSWQLAPAPSDEVVRRYDLDPWRVKDLMLGETTGRKDALAPNPFHALLLRRIDAS